MPVIKAQQVPKKTQKAVDVLAKFCYYFPQYTFNQAKKMPYKRVSQMLSVVRKERAKFKSDLVKIVTAPHTKKGKGVTNLIQYFKEIIEE